MRILLIGNYPLDRQESMLRYAALLQRELVAAGHVVTLLQPRPLLGRLVRSGSGLGKWLGYIDKFLLFPTHIQRALPECDLVHICDHSNSIYVRALGTKPHVVTCHDVLAITSALGEVPENRVSATGRKLQQMILSGLKQAQFIVCVSTHTQQQMLRVTGRPASSSAVVLSSLPYPYSPMPREEAIQRLDALGYDARQPFLLHVGSSTWYKNRLGLLRIFDRFHKLPGQATARLLMVGDPLAGEVALYIRRKGLESRVVQLGGLSNEDLRATYSLAEAFLFPSLTEGFGWPLLEAQACGCPSFATNRSPMTEVGGSAAMYFDPADPDAAAAIIQSGLPNRDHMGRDGLLNASRFSVQQMIEGLVAVYERVLASASRRGSRA
jgi:glycosyltransferase involved in cell wall biosynthesis